MDHARQATRQRQPERARPVAAAPRRQGFALLTVLFLLVMVAVLAVSLGQRSALRARMTGNYVTLTRAQFAREALIGQGIWQLSVDPSWRTPTRGQTCSFDGSSWRLTVSDASVAGFTDAILLQCRAPSAQESTSLAVRYFAATAAGTGAAGYAGDGGPAVEATLRGPRGLCVNATGTLYIADRDNHCIRAITPEGVLSTVAGTGIAGYGGDGGPAATALLHSPSDVSLDAEGNLYVADTGNHCIRRIDAQAGTIAMIAGKLDTNGVPVAGSEDYALSAPEGLFAGDAGQVYIADTGNHRVQLRRGDGSIVRIAGLTGDAGYNSDGISATAARLNHPSGVCATGGGEVLIADTFNHRVRRIDVYGNISTVAGNGVAGLSGEGSQATSASLHLPRDVCADANGNLFVVNEGSCTLRLVSHRNGTIRTLAGTGTSGYNGDDLAAAETELAAPRGAAVSMNRSGREFFIADTGNQRVRRVALRPESRLY